MQANGLSKEEIMRYSTMLCSLLFTFSISVTSSEAGQSFIAMDYNAATDMNRFVSVDAATGAETVLKSFKFPSGFYNTGTGFEDPVTGIIYIQDASGPYVAYNPTTNELSIIPSGGGFGATFPTPLPGGVDGVVHTDSSGATHLGPHSLITKEMDGIQQLYATDASGNPIAINVTNGSDLKVNGTSVMGSISAIQSGGTTFMKTNMSGAPASASGANSLALGADSSATGSNSIAIGAGSVASEDNTVSIGSATVQRRITGLAPGMSPTDAVNVEQMKSEVSSATIFMKTNMSGAPASASGANSLALGADSSATGSNSIAIGAGSVASEDNTVSIGSATVQRRITGLAPGTGPTDAVNVEQMKREMNGAFSRFGAQVNQTGAMSSAMSQMNASASGIPSDNRVAIGFGIQGSSTAVAFGYQRSIAKSINFTLGGAVSGNEATAGAGLGFGW
jgi:hypothetical protein